MAKSVAEKAPRRSGWRTNQAAKFAVASELCKRGYKVELTVGKRHGTDITVTSPEGATFGVNVSSLYKPNPFLLNPKEPAADLYSILALVPDEGQNRFFVFTRAEANQAIQEQLEYQRGIAVSTGKPKADDKPGIGWQIAERFENRWATLPK